MCDIFQCKCVTNRIQNYDNCRSDAFSIIGKKFAKQAIFRQYGKLIKIRISFQREASIVHASLIFINARGGYEKC